MPEARRLGAELGARPITRALELLGGLWERLPSFTDDEKGNEGGPADWIAFLGRRAGIGGVSEHTAGISLDGLAPGKHRLTLTAFFTGAYPAMARLESDFVLPGE